MATKIPIIKYREFLHISMCYISAINEDIASKFTSVMQGNKWRIQKIKWPWNVKVKVKHIKNHENHLLIHNFGTGSRRNFWLVGKHSLQNSASVSYPQILTYDVMFWRYVTSNQSYDFFTFSKIVNSQPIFLKMYTHIAWTYTMYLAKNCIAQKNVTYVSMATKIPIIKYREFLHISMCYISANNEDIAISPLIMKISLQNFHQSCKGTNGEFTKIKWPWNVKVKVKHIKNHENHL